MKSPAKNILCVVSTIGMETEIWLMVFNFLHLYLGNKWEYIEFQNKYFDRKTFFSKVDIDDGHIILYIHYLVQSYGNMVLVSEFDLPAFDELIYIMADSLYEHHPSLIKYKKKERHEEMKYIVGFFKHFFPNNGTFLFLHLYRRMSYIPLPELFAQDFKLLPEEVVYESLSLGAMYMITDLIEEYFSAKPSE